MWDFLTLRKGCQRVRSLLSLPSEIGRVLQQVLDAMARGGQGRRPVTTALNRPGALRALELLQDFASQSRLSLRRHYLASAVRHSRHEDSSGAIWAQRSFLHYRRHHWGRSAMQHVARHAAGRRHPAGRPEPTGRRPRVID